MKKILLLPLLAALASAQVNVQKTSGTNVISNGSLVVGNGTSITATGNGTIVATSGTASSVPWSGVTGTPTTLSGYGVTNTLSTTAPLAGGGTLSSNLTLSLPAATSSTNGYLTSTDWTTFNSKQSAIGPTTSLVAGSLSLAQTPLAVTSGGNGLIAATLGDLRYGSGTNTLAALSGNTSTTTAVLTQTGNGTVSAAPVWTPTTGTGNVVRATSPTLVTPILGAATATSVTGPTTTDLALNGGSSGASLILGRGGNGRITMTAGSSVTFLNTYSDPTADGANLFGGLGAGNLTLSPSGGLSLLASRNTAWGYYAGNKLTTGYQNSLFGTLAGSSLTTGNQNDFFGNISGGTATTASANTGFGNNSLGALTTGNMNVAKGEGALRFLTTGSSNVGLGHGAGYSVTTGSNNVFVGESTGVGSPTSLTNAIAIGANVAPAADNTGIIGNSSTTDVYFGGTGAVATVRAAKGRFAATTSGSTPALDIRPYDAASGTVQYWSEYLTAGGTVLVRLLRGNGASGFQANGLNIDSFGGFQVRANQLGGSGEKISFQGAPVEVSASIDGVEQASSPAAPATNGFRLYAKDNGAGKTAVYIRFATGAEQQIAIEP